MTDDELPDFEDFGDAPESEESTDDGEEQEVHLRRIQNEQENPIGLDPRVGEKDVAYDRAKPGAKVYVVQILAETVADYYEEFPDAPALDDYAGNVITSFTDEDAVFACVYLKDSLTSVDTNLTAYPMPESRLTRYPAEQASMVGSASVEFERTRLPGEVHRLAGAEPATQPDVETDGGQEIRPSEVQFTLPENHYLGKTVQRGPIHVFDREERRSLCRTYNSDGVTTVSFEGELPDGICGACSRHADYLTVVEESEEADA